MFNWFKNKDKKASQDKQKEQAPRQASTNEAAEDMDAEQAALSEEAQALEQKASELREESLQDAAQEQTNEGAQILEQAPAEALLEQEIEPSAEPSAVPVPEQKQSDEPAPESEPLLETELPIEPEQAPEKAPEQAKASSQQGFFARLKSSLSRTKENIGSGFVALLKGKSIDDDLYEELETQLLVADVGIKTTAKIIKELTEKAKLSQLKDGDALGELLKQQMRDILSSVSVPLDLVAPSSDEGNKTPFVILMVGVNGVGKTTTIGKLAKQFQADGKKVMLAAGDTFRAAAVEQLQVWGERNNIGVIAQPTGSDSASVIFDAVASAKAKGADVLIADTAGRLQNKDNLIEELKKVVRVMKKQIPEAPHEIMLTLDASTGQNAVSQTKIFNEAVGITGINLTKLDGTAKGGVIFALADEFNIPVRYIGIGEGIDDLRPFDAGAFVDALFDDSGSGESSRKAR
ncbi:signal recognition particle-docking protein FtsY [Glaciecola siphonariae]|uniref:Signal recognition particle receptor FtsY n=1 Tax=Glaciecola siphonariae TaxID=521012 RepID=A0ABV9LWI0_9ALTE